VIDGGRLVTERQLEILKKKNLVEASIE